MIIFSIITSIIVIEFRIASIALKAVLREMHDGSKGNSDKARDHYVIRSSYMAKKN